MSTQLETEMEEKHYISVKKEKTHDFPSISRRKSSYLTVLPAFVLNQCIHIFSGSYHNVSVVLTVSYKHNVCSIPSSQKQIPVGLKKTKKPNPPQNVKVSYSIRYHA